jgi:hypothetical protein
VLENLDDGGYKEVQVADVHKCRNHDLYQFYPKSKTDETEIDFNIENQNWLCID